MNICIGSKNPVKFKALEIISSQFFPDSPVNIESFDADSMVSNQPMDLKETITGAVNRSVKAYESGTFDIGCGIESGIFNDPCDNSVYNNTVCSIYDGSKIFKGIGPGFKLPENVASMLFNDKMELDDAVKIAGYTKNARIGYDKGLIGILSRGKVDRMAYTLPAVQMAFTAFINNI